MIRSMILLATHVKNMDLKFDTADASLFLYTGVTIACAPCFGHLTNGQESRKHKREWLGKYRGEFFIQQGWEAIGSTRLSALYFSMTAKTRAGEKSMLLSDAVSRTTRLIAGMIPLSVVQTELK